MEKKYTCFVISPIGESGSDIRREADFLLNLIINPTLKEYGFNVMRGDHRAEANQIDVDVIKCVQEADLCICNLSEPNVNVYYELGRRDETGKPIILMKSKQSVALPVDIATRRYIEFDLENPQGILDAMSQLHNFVRPLIENGLQESSKAASLYEIANVLLRVERKVDRLASVRTSTKLVDKEDDGSVDEALLPQEMFKLALIQGDVAKAEKAMFRLQPRMAELDFYDLIVEQVAVMGSVKAGEMMIDFAAEFFDSDISYLKKTEYLGCLVTYALKRNKEMDVLDMIESVCSSLIIEGTNAEASERAQIHNQLNRLYFGIYNNTKEESWLYKAISELEKAIHICPAGHLHYNLALCLTNINDYETAEVHAEKAIEMDIKDDIDHIELLCEIYHKLDNPNFMDVFSKLKELSPGKAILLSRKLKA